MKTTTEAPHRRTGSYRRWLLCAAAALSLTSVSLMSGTESARAAQLLNYSGTTGYVVGFGHQLCNPFLSSGFAGRYIELVGPLVYEAPASAPVYVGGGQEVVWRPQLEKYINGRWDAVWLGPWYGATGYSGDLEVLQSKLVDVYQIQNGGAGFYRLAGTVWWKADSVHAGGWINYRLGQGEYLTDGVAHARGASARPVSTPYCYAG